MIEVASLSRHFDARVAVDDLSFVIPAGQLCVLLGPNGAGKTTTVRMLMGLIRPTAGSATVAGIAIPGEPASLSRLRSRVGLLTETPGFYERLSGKENLVLFGQLYGLTPSDVHARTQPLLELLGIWDRRDELVGTYSKGMKQKLALVRAVFHDPEVIFFDEPTSGLDPESARVVRAMIGSLKRAGRTMIVCTHNLSEGAALADVVAVIRSRLLAFGPASAIVGSAQSTRCRITVAGDAGAARDVARRQSGVRAVDVQGAHLDLELDDVHRAVPPLVAALVGAGCEILEVRPRERTLEEFYLEAIGAEP